MADSLDGQDDRMKECRDRRYPGVKQSFLKHGLHRLAHREQG